MRVPDPTRWIVSRFTLALAAAAVVSCAPDGTAPEPTTSSPSLQRGTSDASREPTLLARAILPSDAYQPGPPSGAFISPDNGVTPPFPGQPIPGFSAVLDAGHGTFWGMPDNGYGAKGNSGDFLLRVYRIRPDFKTAKGGNGAVEVLGFIQLR